MTSKPRIFVFSIIPKLGDIIQQMLPQENIKIVKFQAEMSQKYGHVISEEEINQLKEAEVLLADSNAFVQFADRLPHLKWFQSTWAGVEGLMQHFQHKKAPPYFMSRLASDSFSQLMSEYVVGQIIAHERGWGEAASKQANCVWYHSGRVATYRSLRDITVALLGFGQIGQEIGRALKSFKCHVLAYSLTAHSPTGLHQCADAHYHGDSLATVMSESDYIVSCLPSTPLTAGLLSAAILQHAKNGSVLINIGRGNVVSEDDLLAALDAGPLAGAVLDVFQEEPLLPSSLLWTHPKVVVTPHCAGVSRASDVAKAFVQNYGRFAAGEKPQFLLDFYRGY